MTTINFELTKPFKYANGSGAEVECSHIELREPTGKVSHICCDIEALIQSAMVKMSDILDDDTIEQAKEQAKNKKKDNDEKMDRETVLVMMSSGGADMKKIVLHFRELFKIVAFMGGEKELTSARMDDMSHKDFKNMMGEYAANFIMS